jgi:hypothetical protein
VVLTKPVCVYAGEIETSNFCLICKGLFKRVPVHMRNVHSEEPRVKAILALSKRDQALEFEQLLREGNFTINNAVAMTTLKGFVLPTRRSPDFRAHTALMHCCRCFSLIERYNYNRHVDRCPRKGQGGEAPNLWEEKQNQFEM